VVCYMSRIRTADDLYQAFDRDLVWRRKELSDLKRSVEVADRLARAGLSRALLLMAYAHWEGFVKNCSRAYFDFLAVKKRPYAEYEVQIYTNRFLSEIDSFFGSKAGVQKKCDFIEKIILGKKDRFSTVSERLVDTKSNLNSDVLLELCRVINIDNSIFRNKNVFIDIKLLKRRNSIAHGSQEFPDIIDFQEIMDGVLELMGEFRNLIENKVSQQSYLIAPPVR
jgi:RiboL-PSP-HEPN